jgi:hypothetical protein
MIALARCKQGIYLLAAFKPFPFSKAVLCRHNIIPEFRNFAYRQHRKLSLMTKIKR